MSKQPWVVLDAVKQEMRCNRCHETEPLSIITGKRLNLAVGYMKAFTNAHKGCAVSDIEDQEGSK